MNINIFTQIEFKKHISENKVQVGYLELPVGILKVEFTGFGIFGAEFVEHHIGKRLTTINSLILVGTKFQIDVWLQTLNIKSGTTESYQNVAKLLNKPNHTRAVAQALANNKIAYFVPCHRVIAKNGDISGYKWGREIKLQLLRAEGALL